MEKNMEKPRLFISIILSVLVLIIFNKYFAPSTPSKVQEQTQNPTSPNLENNSGLDNKTNLTPGVASQSKMYKEFILGPFELNLGNYLGDFSKFDVNVSEISQEVTNQKINFIEKLNLRVFNGIKLGEEPFIGNWNKVDDKIIFEGKNKDGSIRQVIEYGNNYSLNVKNNIELNTNNNRYIFLENTYAPFAKTSGGFLGNSYGNFEKGYFYSKDSNKTLSSEKDYLNGYEGKSNLSWFGINTRYFALLTDLDKINSSAILARALQFDHKNVLQTGIAIDGNKSIELNYSIYAGPKLHQLLTLAKPSYVETLEFGIFSVISFPLLSCLKFYYSLVRNYGLAIILLTLTVKTLTFPLAYKGIKGMKKMSKIQPILQDIRKKHKEDPLKMNQETMRIMKEHKANPFGSCIIMIIQIPVFFALYRVLLGAIDLYGAPFYLWIHDLTNHDPYYVFPILMGISWFFQQKLTPNTTMDPTQQKVLQFMPVMFTVFMLNMPAGLSIYMFVNSIFSILQQCYFNKKFV